MLVLCLCSVKGQVCALSASGFLGRIQICGASGSCSDGWEMIFYFFGSLGVLWYPIWLWRGYELPQDHPRFDHGSAGERVISTKNNYESIKTRY